MYHDITALLRHWLRYCSGLPMQITYDWDQRRSTVKVGVFATAVDLCTEQISPQISHSKSGIYFQVHSLHQILTLV